MNAPPRRRRPVGTPLRGLALGLLAALGIAPAVAAAEEAGSIRHWAADFVGCDLASQRGAPDFVGCDLASQRGAASAPPTNADPNSEGYRELGDASQEAQRFEFVSRQMGTLFQIVLYAPDATTAQTAAASAWARVAQLNRLLSDYDANSELMRLCQAPAGTATTVSAELFELLQHSQQLAAASGGAFDVTLGPAVRLWREARRTRQLPSAAERAAALQASGHANLRLNAADRTVTLLVPGMQLDLGGIAKGYAADAALAVLARHGLRRAMVAASGDLALGDAPPGVRGWKIELAPFGPAAAEPLVLVLANAAVSTSGDAEQGFDFGGARYSHILDPATGLGLTTPVAVTVVARRATQSDALATALSVLAGNARERIPACLGPAAHAFVFHREADGRVRQETYGLNPAALFSSL